MAGQVSGRFGLDVISYLLKDFRFGRREFEPGGEWRGLYSVYTLAGRGTRAGSLRIRREASSKERFALHVNYEKFSAGHVQEVEGRMLCGMDELSSPVEWSVSSRVKTLAGKALAGLDLKKTAKVSGGSIVISDRGGSRTVKVSGRYTVNWALFDAVQRLGCEAFSPIEFTMIDHFDQVKGEQVISYRGAFEEVINGQKVKLHAYDHLGRGVVPWIYWVDERGRLVFVVSGIEAYILDGPALRERGARNG